VERRHAARKARHKKHQIAKQDRNDDHNKRREAGEQGVSSDKDPSPKPSWSGVIASAAVDWSNMSGLSSSSPPRGAEVSLSCRPREVGQDKTVGSSSRPVAFPARVGLRSTLSLTHPAERALPSRRDPRSIKSIPPRRSEERSVSVHQIYDGSDCPDFDSLQRCRLRGRSSYSVSTPSAAPVAEPSSAQRCLQSLLIWGGGAPDFHVPLIAGGGHGPTPAIAEAGGTAPERMGESVATVEATKTVDSRRVVPEQVKDRYGEPERGGVNGSR
jgi:hypothetical protein